MKTRVEYDWFYGYGDTFTKQLAALANEGWTLAGFAHQPTFGTGEPRFHALVMRIVYEPDDLHPDTTSDDETQRRSS